MFIKVLIFSTLAAVISAETTNTASSTTASTISSTTSSETSSTITSTITSSPGAAETTVNLFLGPNAHGGHYVGSVVNANACGTTYQIACPSNVLSSSLYMGWCPDPATYYATYGHDSYGFSTEIEYGTAEGPTTTSQMIQTCSWDGTTAAVCNITQAVTSHGKKSSMSYALTLSSDSAFFAPVSITAGASKLQVSHLAACTASSSAAAAATGISEVYKVLVVPAVALLAAGL